MRYIIKELSGASDGKPFELWEAVKASFWARRTETLLGRFATKAQVETELARRVAYNPPTVRATSEYNEHGDRVYPSW